jgi:hypothetical protein
MSRLSTAVLGFCLALAPFQTNLFAQAGSSSLASVGSTYNLGTATFGAGGVQYTVAITIAYAQSLTPSQYIAPSVLTSNFNSFVSSYPNAGDPPEAILLSAANQFANMYSQFSVVTLEAAAGAITTTGTLSGFQADIIASAGNLSVPGLPTGSMRKALKAQPAQK